MDAVGVRQRLQMKLVNSFEIQEVRGKRRYRKLRGMESGKYLYMKIYGDMV